MSLFDVDKFVDFSSTVNSYVSAADGEMHTMENDDSTEVSFVAIFNKTKNREQEFGALMMFDKSTFATLLDLNRGCPFCSAAFIFGEMFISAAPQQTPEAPDDCEHIERPIRSDEFFSDQTNEEDNKEESTEKIEEILNTIFESTFKESEDIIDDAVGKAIDEMFKDYK